MRKAPFLLATTLSVTAIPPAIAETPKTKEECTPQIHFFDVKKSDATLIQCGKTDILIDTGKNKDIVKKLQSFIQDGIIELFIATHKDTDHIGQTQNIFDAFEVKEIWRNGKEAKEKTKAIQQYFQAIQLEEGIQDTVAHSGMTKKFNNMQLKVCNDKDPRVEKNYSSLVVKITHENISALLTGDAERFTHKEILQHCPEQVDLLKVAHHGSENSITTEFLEILNPEFAIVSTGKKGMHNTPLKLLNTMNIPIMRTDKDGDIHCIVAQDNHSTYSCEAEGKIETVKKKQKKASQKK